MRRLQEALENSQQSIKASDQPVSQADFTQALTDAFGYAPVLHCHNDKSSGNSYISEVSEEDQLQDCCSGAYSPRIGAMLTLFAHACVLPLWWRKIASACTLTVRCYRVTYADCLVSRAMRILGLYACQSSQKCPESDVVCCRSSSVWTRTCTSWTAEMPARLAAVHHPQISSAASQSSTMRQIFGWVPHPQDATCRALKSLENAIDECTGCTLRRYDIV